MWRRRRKTVLIAVGSVVLVSAAALQVYRGRVERYASGEHTEGIVDKLAAGVPDDHPLVEFHDVAQESGLVFHHFPGERANRLPEDMGSGVALGDVDGDGWTDVFLAGAAPLDGEASPSRLFRGGPDGRFEDWTEPSGIELAAMAMGAAFCDVDSDGDLDLFVTTYGTCRLFLNDGSGRFQDASAATGLDQHEGFWAGVAVGDYDADGAVDLYVCGYVVYDEALGARGAEESPYGRVIPALLNPSTFGPERNLLFRGRGDGTFEEVADELGVANATGRSLGALFCDLNGDGHQDLYVANDVSDNAYFVNRGDGTFVDETTGALLGDYRGAMGMAAADFDGDQDLDLYVTHWVAQENALYAQFPQGERSESDSPSSLFVDEADRYGLGYQGLEQVGWATRFFDYDNDGLLDLFVVNGHTIPEEDEPTQLQPMRSQLFWRSPAKRRFFEVGAVSGDFFREKHVGRGGATFDYDLDGDEDLVISLHGEAARLLRNDGGNANGCLRVRLRQPTGNRFALGARVWVQCGERTVMEVVGTQGSYLSQHAVGEVAFGLGNAGGVDRIEVVWPDGEREETGPLLAPALVTWERGSAPRAEPFPGRRELDTSAPRDVAVQRRFYAIRKEAQSARLRDDAAAAVASYRSALALWPGHGDCLYYLGNSLLESGQELAALQAFERLVAYESHSNRGWMQIGLLRLPGGDPGIDDIAAARKAFTRCHDLNKEESRPVLQLGVVAMLEENYAEARRHLADAARLNPASAEAVWFEGRVAWLQEERAEAAQLLTRAHGLARGPATSDSASSEGDTRAGAALTADAGPELAPGLTRWKTMRERDPDPELEYEEH
ncbi:MAG: tetratricopeptide repeat protein [bacterium]|nr:tetratricopeptide repeat protein [bacterium]